MTDTTVTTDAPQKTAVVQDVVWLDPDAPIVAPNGMELIPDSHAQVGDEVVIPASNAA